ncbi:MAG: sugar kinase [Deltaproteobacteria bacterium GWC2_42_51]|nr:MAG: sugar kinase [Deltaproteobacteria bacterium GWA2_42_85]OGP34718.1 MAG: sugar kinase [Deltaproteobacteria bacterium GWC2_42_51]OGP41218.1 MAG: sugar kinase [Deltaproteobacteria bacterium GWD2_42_10]OGP48950.1 MAG: sugar kinase [Deltaproteobacteria bacterium GWF2_42_12]OGQ27879.1 MAG: sugar kinase [Deltaproteobacteria bacterium RIFCSPHIGHO2_02_FULL_42_44]OGQ37717.1 MAG: sugar kinase [Deltaproteobacteria bacterium RIFCSPLOWO2_02_FULL_42_39]OGQ70093.1 MAG: sugar kinase [Deltaproteobacteri
MGILVVGSVALDSVETPFGKADNVLGGSATYFSTAASYFTDVSLVAVIGEDFPDEHINFLKEKGVDTNGLQKIAGKTFRWQGRYEYDLNEAHTIATHLNVFKKFKPHIPAVYTKSPYVFLANIDPEIQLNVLEQVKKPKFVACDTMNFWIEGKPDALKGLLSKVDLFVLNEGEAREFAKEPNLVKAAKKILAYGPKTVIIKRGEYGALMFNGGSIFSAPAYPLESVFDPTGAGDSFAGGLIGYLANIDNTNESNIRQAIIFGSVMASFNVEDFSLNRMRTLTLKEIYDRYRKFKQLTHFEDIS